MHLEDSTSALPRQVSTVGARVVELWMPFEDLMTIRGIEVDPAARHRRSIVHVVGGDWHFQMACTAECK